VLPPAGPPSTRGHDEWGGADDPDALPLDLAQPPPQRERAAVGLRRGLTLLVLAFAIAEVVATHPYWSLALLLGLSWLLRTCTTTVTAHGDRRRLRGARWYDVLLAPLSAPWYLIAAIPGSLLLGGWALGVGVAGWLLAYAAGLSTPTTLFVTGVCVEAGLWLGPGSSHVRWPVRVVTQAVARQSARWAVVTAVLLAVGGFAAHQAAGQIGWSPFGKPSFVGNP
jgi:hypothetical protein